MSGLPSIPGKNDWYIPQPKAFNGKVVSVNNVYNDRLSSVKSQLVHAEQRCNSLRACVGDSPRSPKMKEEIWAWEMFSKNVLPMLLFVDE
jgi:hypothetical protein